ncbi:MAG: YgiQ family radical SAM protein [Clostridia bacterium]|nr:YgiQ family radical SAM protein [Clostridia bacterium]
MFLPVSRRDMKERGWSECDIVFVSGDAYVDHPSFAPAVITRVLDDAGFRVGVLAQPEWKKSPDAFCALGRPRLCFMVCAGNIDSMVAHYTVAKNRRSFDEYSPGGRTGLRPDRCTETYCRRLKEAFPDCPVVIGGVEASLRRFAHYDYWRDAVLPSILESSGADLLVYGMGEKAVVEIAKRLDAGETVGGIRGVRGTCYLCPPAETPWGGRECPSFELVARDKRLYAKSALVQQQEQDAVRGRTLLQRQNRMMLVQNPPMPVLTREELDRVYELPYMRKPHPMYGAPAGGGPSVPAIEEVEFSVCHNRGCFGGCSFCAITLHQGRAVSSRSRESVLREIRLLTTLEGFKGYIHDVGGPTANFRLPSCALQAENGLCRDRRCLAPKPCPNLVADHTEYLDVLRAAREVPGVKKVFIRSGVRFDYALADKSDEFIRELVEHHVSGQLKLAPEHCSATVLDLMGKPHIEAYKRFAKKYFELSKKAGKEQYIVPYLMSSHPGSRLEDAVELAEFIRDEGLRPEQVQDFYPTPGTISTAMYHSGFDPYTGKEVYCAKDPHEKAMQRALLRWFDPKNADLVREALTRAKRTDLIGFGAKCLVKPASGGQSNKKSPPKNKKQPPKNRKR